MILDNRDKVRIESYLEDCIKQSMNSISDLNSFAMHITGFDNGPKYIRVTLYYDDLIKGRDIIQPRVKEIMKEIFELSEIELARCYEATCDKEENMYEMMYKLPEKKLEMLYILSKLRINY